MEVKDTAVQTTRRIGGAIPERHQHMLAKSAEAAKPMNAFAAARRENATVAYQADAVGLDVGAAVGCAV